MLIPDKISETGCFRQRPCLKTMFKKNSTASVALQIVCGHVGMYKRGSPSGKRHPRPWQTINMSVEILQDAETWAPS